MSKMTKTVTLQDFKDALTVAGAYRVVAVLPSGRARVSARCARDGRFSEATGEGADIGAALADCYTQLKELVK